MKNLGIVILIQFFFGQIQHIFGAIFLKVKSRLYLGKIQKRGCFRKSPGCIMTNAFYKGQIQAVLGHNQAVSGQIQAVLRQIHAV